VTAMKERCQERRHRQCGGNDTDAQFARQFAVDLSQLLPKRIFVCQDFLRPAQDLPAFGRQSAKAPTVTVDQRPARARAGE
jgi:hypothetical protein